MKKVTDSLESLPGVGKSIAQDLRNIGINKPSDLRGKNPQRLYDTLSQFQGQQIDRCMLYVMRCAVYFVSNTRHDPKKLNWWNWKD
jgi:hypothetical protein